MRYRTATTRRSGIGAWVQVALLFVAYVQLQVTRAQFDSDSDSDSDAALNTTQNTEVDDLQRLRLEIHRQEAAATESSAEAWPIEPNEQNWWYERIQENHVEQLVNEFKGTSVGQPQDDMFSILQPNKTSSMVVQFYSSNPTECPVECTNLRDHFLQLARRISLIIKPTLNTNDKLHLSGSDNVTQSVSFHVVNCAVHTELCQQQRVKYFPTIRVYQHTHSSSTQSYKSLQKNPITDISFQHLHPYEVLDKLGIVAYDLPDVDRDIDLVTNHGEDQGGGSDAIAQIDNAQTTLHGRSYQHRSRKELFQDIHIALDYMLRVLIFSTNMTDHHIVPVPHTNHPNDLTITEQEVLKSFLLLLQKTLPSTTEDVRVRAMIQTVIDKFVYAVKNHNYMGAIVKDYRPVTAQYSRQACPTVANDDSNDDKTKYTCVMWDILLLISVGMVDYNSKAYDATELIHPASALHTMFECVQLFGLLMDTPAKTYSAVDTVQTQFIDLYNDCTFMNRCQLLPNAPKIIYESDKNQVSKEYMARIITTHAEWKLVSLYIASARNITLQASNPTRDEIWPPISICSLCWKSGTDGTFAALTHDETNLYKYLKIEYGHIDATTATYRHELMLQDSSQSSHPRFAAETANPIDPAVLATKRHLQATSKSDKMLTMRHGSICMIFLIVSLLQRLYSKYAGKTTRTKSGEAIEQSKTANGLDVDQRTIANTFDNDESRNLARRISPTKRQRLKDMNRRILIEQEKDNHRKHYAKSSSFRLMALEASTYDHSNELPPLPLSESKTTTDIYINSSNVMDAVQQIRRRKFSCHD